MEHNLDVYESLGVRRVVNADARRTALGGSVMPDYVWQAMREAGTSHVDIVELQERVGSEIAELTRNEKAYVTCGATAGIVLAVVACMTRGDAQAVSRLPATDGLPTEVLVHRCQRLPYDLAVDLAGGHVVPFGYVHRTEPVELEARITERTAAILYVAGEHLAKAALSLEDTVAIAKAHGVPVIVDAAAQLPPPDNLWRFTREAGADLAIFSGGKELRGPQSTGLIVGSASLVDACEMTASPHHRLGRPFKVGKEEMAGLLAAVRGYLAEDYSDRLASLEATVEFWIERLNVLPGVRAERVFPNEAGQPTPRVHVTVADQSIRADQIMSSLWDGDPRVAVARAGSHAVYITPDTLVPGEEKVVVQRLEEVLASDLSATGSQGQHTVRNEGSAS